MLIGSLAEATGSLNWYTFTRVAVDSQRSASVLSEGHLGWWGCQPVGVRELKGLWSWTTATLTRWSVGGLVEG